MITTKERAKLRALAQKLDPVVQIGKGGITQTVIEGTKLVLEKRELVKIRLLNNSGLDTKEAMQVLCAWLGADPVQQIGSVLVIYKFSTHKDAKHVLWFLIYFIMSAYIVPLALSFWVKRKNFNHKIVW